MINNNTYLVITPIFPSNNSFRGSYIFDQIKELRIQTNFNIVVVKVVSLFSCEKDYIFNGFSIKIFKIIDFPFFIFPGSFNFINKIRFNIFLKKKLIKDISFSHSHISYPSSYLVEDLRCKKIIQHHGLDVLQLLNGRSKIITFLQRNFIEKNTIRHLNKADLIVGVSKLVLIQLRAFKNYNPKDEYVLYNGVDTEKFFKKITNNNDYFTLGCVANFWKIKDQITLIKAVHSIINTGEIVNLRLIGSGTTLKSCKEYVKLNDLSKYIFFEKEVAHNLLNDFYNKIDLFILPSYYEALGCVYLESWATGTPFIAIKNQGISELVPNDRSDLLADKNSVDSLIEKILYKPNRAYLQFDMRYSIKNTISNFLKKSIFNDKK